MDFEERVEIDAIENNDSDSWYGSFTKHTTSDNSGEEG